jgi:hypothetical protein
MAAVRSKGAGCREEEGSWLQGEERELAARWSKGAGCREE